MTGFRLGYIAAPPAFTKSCNVLQSQVTSCANSISQKAALQALKEPEALLTAIVAEMEKKRDFVYDSLRAIPGVVLGLPNGAFYAMPDISCYFGRATPRGTAIENSNDFALALLDEVQVALVPGNAFGAPGKIRLSFATSMEELGQCMERISKFCSSLSPVERVVAAE
jgi:aspartate aminotransferase